MNTHQTVHRTVIIENTSHLDTVTIDLDIKVDCNCTEPNSYVTVDAS